MRVGISCFGQKLGLSGGTQIYRRELINALASFDRSNQYVILKWEDDEISLDDLPPNFTTVVFPSPSTDFMPRLKRAVINCCFQDKPSALSRQIDSLALNLIHFPVTRMYPSNVATPAVLTFFDMQQEFYPENFSITERLRRRLTYRPSAQKATTIISPSIFTTETLVQRYNIAIKKIKQIPVGIAGHYRPEPDPQVVASVCQNYRLPEEFIVYPANTWPHKNHRRLLKALALLYTNHGLRINLVCTGARLNNQESLAQMSRSVGFPEQQVFDIDFARLEDMPAIYSAAKMMVFPSLFEGFGIPVLEAMASGCPVVCANTTSLPEVGGDAVQAFDPLDVPAMAETIRRAWEDAELREAMIRKGLTRAEQYRWERVIPQLVEVYKQVGER